MTKLVEIPVGDSTVLVEVARTESGRAVAMSADDRTREKVVQSLDQSLGVITKLSGAMTDTLKKTGAKSAEISLGLKFTAKGTLFVAETSTEATLSLKLSFASSN
jgi:Trypsin-co-occurring domain 1